MLQPQTSEWALIAVTNIWFLWGFWLTRWWPLGFNRTDELLFYLNPLWTGLIPSVLPRERRAVWTPLVDLNSQNPEFILANVRTPWSCDEASASNMRSPFPLHVALCHDEAEGGSDGFSAEARGSGCCQTWQTPTQPASPHIKPNLRFCSLSGQQRVWCESGDPFELTAGLTILFCFLISTGCPKTGQEQEKGKVSFLFVTRHG